MFGSRCKGTLFVTCAWAGFCCGQEVPVRPVPATCCENATPVGACSPSNRTCRVISTRQNEDGTRTSQLQDVVTGETFTVIETQRPHGLLRRLHRSSDARPQAVAASARHEFLPQARADGLDPIMHVPVYADWSTAVTPVGGRTAMSTEPSTVPFEDAPVPEPAGAPAAGKRRSGFWGSWGRKAPAKDATPPPAAWGSAYTPGARSVLAAGPVNGDTYFVPVPVMAPPPPRMPSTDAAAPAAPAVAQAPADTGNAFSPRSGTVAGGFMPSATQRQSKGAFPPARSSNPQPAVAQGPAAQSWTPSAGVEPGPAGPTPTIVQTGHATVSKAPAIVSDGAAVEQSPEILAATLQAGLYPAHRQWAAKELGNPAWGGLPPVVEALIQGAQQDPSPAVRVSCVRSLAAVGAGHEEVTQVLVGLQKDSDSRVRHEAFQALARVSER